MAREFKTTEDVIAAGEEKKLITIRDGRITYEGTKGKKSYQFTDPEEKVRARVYVELIEKYKYPASRIDTEVYPPSRAPPYPADVVVYEDDEHEKVFIVVEVKADSSERNIEIAKREGLGNANLLNTKYLLLVCGEEELSYDVSSKPSLSSLEKYIISQIPPKYGKLPKYKFKKEREKSFFDLRYASLNELNNKFQRCHNEIWEGGKRDPAVSFDEMSKLMFSKIYDERFTVFGDYYRYQIGSHESPSVIAERVKELYKEAQRNEPEVFKAPIELSDEMVFRVVEILQDISLAKTDLDSKGRAFEKFLGKFFRGEYGQYFTPRQIVEFMVKMLEPNARELVIDPACGSGGFLLYSLNLVRERVNKDYEGDPDTIKDIIWRFANKQIFGIEINDRIARVAMMDMVIHEDGHSNIECANALQDFENFDPRRDIKPNKYDFVFTNPPFGAVEKNQKILGLYELGSKNRKRKSQKKEILFIERCLNLLRFGGKMGIVLPDGILTNSSLKYVRDFIEENAKILAVVSLPQQTFVPSGSGVKTSLLFLQKKRGGEDLGEYPIFMAIAEHVGYDATGRPDKNDFPEVLGDWGRFKEGKRDFSNAPRAFAVMRGELENRMDAFYYGTKKQVKDYSISVKYLDDVAVVNPKRRISVVSEDLVPYVGLPETDEDLGELIEIKYRPYKEIKGRHVINGGDILFARIEPSIYNQKVIFVDGLEDYALTSTEFYVVRANPEVNEKFLFYMMRSDFIYKQIFGKVTGTTGRRRLDVDLFRNFVIPFPSRSIQDRIAKIMEEAYKQRKEKLKEAENLLAGINDFVLDKLGIEIPEVEEKKTFVVTLKDLKEGKRHDPFYCLPRFKELIKELGGRDDILPLKEITSTIMSGQRPKGGVRNIENGVPSLGGEHVNADGTIKTKGLKYIPFDFHKKYSKTSIKPLDILVVKDGATTGKVGIVPLNFPYNECNINEHVFLIRVKDNIESYYVFSFLQSAAGRIQIQRKITGAAQTGITKDVVNSLLISIPLIEIQKEIAGEVRRRRERAKELQEEAEEVIKQAKEKVKRMILGEEK
jgi:type I restriction enzyme M protein